METRHVPTFRSGAVNIPFTAAEGLAKPWLYVSLFLTPALLHNLFLRTNEHLMNASAAPTSQEEMTQFIWLRYYMGIVEVPKLRMYWEIDSFDGIFGNSFVRSLMSRDRFLELESNFSADIDLIEGSILACCKLYMIPAQCVDIDEAIAPFKGRYRFRVYIKDKPKTTGLKYLTLTDGNGFLYTFRRYKGEGSSVADICENIVGQLPQAGYIVYGNK